MNKKEKRNSRDRLVKTNMSYFITKSGVSRIHAALPFASAPATASTDVLLDRVPDEF